MNFSGSISTHPLERLPARWWPRVPYLFLIAAVFVAYANVYGNALLFDDNLLITLNQYLRGWDSFGRLLTASTTEGAHIVGGFYRPLQNIIYFFVYQIFGESRFAFHFLNVALHAANACLTYALGRKLNFNPGGAFFAALLWALHPVHTEAVTYVSATADPLFVFFCLLGLIIMLPDFTPRKFALASLLFLLGLFSKETAVIFPLLAASCLYLTNERRLDPKLYLRTWPLWVIAAIYLAWRLTASRFDGPQLWVRFYGQHDFYNLKLYADHFLYRFYTFLATLPVYLGLLLWPAGLHMERAFAVFVSFWQLKVVTGFVMFTAAVAHVLWGRGRRGLPFSWGLLWFAGAHFPDTGLVFPANSLLLEHWMYLPTIGLFLGAGQALSLWLSDRRRWQLAVCGLASATALVLALCTLDQNAVWHDPIAFYNNIFKYGEVSARAHNNLAMAYMERGDNAAAVEEYHHAIAITDTYAETRYNLALALLGMPDNQHYLPEAIDNLNRALAIDPDFYRAYNILAAIYASLGDNGRAAYYQQKAEETQQKRPH